MSLAAEWADQEESVFADLLESIAPNPADALVLIKSYYDESYDETILCTAGYLFTSKAARHFDEDWRKMLRRYRLPFFHMSACNVGKWPYDHLTEPQCIAAATEAIALINEYASVGFCITVDRQAFRETVIPEGRVSTDYEFCSWHCLIAVRAWLDRNPQSAAASYFFEAGHPDEGRSNEMMKRIFRTPGLRKAYRYKSHTFGGKADFTPLQAADLLAWQWMKDVKRKRAGHNKVRGDLGALLDGTPHEGIHGDRERLTELFQQMRARFEEAGFTLAGS